MSNLTPILITRTKVQEMLGGISRTTFYRLRKKWENAGTPFPSPVTEIGAPKGGVLYRYEQVMSFFSKMNLL
ncbi:helix-turn-helix transcriptional regulator [Klebsiella grimontii]|uniref:helix-turn-helix transcriptional regulator n=1 Tax=Klebsiella grimontii TaxID=2058152 RepID=UPI001CCDA29A|nr:helix-turn-helix domain-containing protein [Klebsiella grimontii]MCS0528942.1 helix-turn-helix domain-containing protein [Klebsiella grimontii]